MQKTTIRTWQWVVLSAAGVCAWGISCIGGPSVDLENVKGKKAPADMDAGVDAAPDGPLVECTTENGATECDDENLCTVDTCDNKGECQHTPNANAVPPDSGNPCQPYICKEGGLVQETLSDGTPCGMNMDGVLVCRQGACLSGCLNDGDCGNLMGVYCFDFSCISCIDNIKNGDETDVDCGGHCKKCQGDPCTDPATCKTNKCVDGVCCNADCNKACHACNVEGYMGECVNTPQNQEDLYPADPPDKVCTGQQRCDGKGACKSAINIVCNNAGDCASDFCWTSPMPKVCKLALNAPCSVAEQSDCYTGYCNPMALECQEAPSGTPCIFGDQCDSGTCMNQKCLP